MFNDAVRALFAKPLIARLATLDDDGYPHVVPVWFDVDGADLIFFSDRDTAKVRHALARPQGAATIGGDPGDGAGYLVRGTFSISDDAGHTVARRLLDRYETPARADALAREWANDDIVVLRLSPVKITQVYG